MADNIISQLLPMPWPVVVSDPAAPKSGDPCRFGFLTGMALNDEGLGGVAATETMVDFGIFVADHPVTDTVTGGIAVGASLFYVDATDRLENLSSGYFYGFALETVANGATTTIKVLHVPSPAAGALGAGTVGENNLAAGAVTAAKIGAGAVSGANLATAFLKVTVQAGENETSTNQITCNGMAVGDEVVAVLVLTTAASIATLAAHAGTFTAAAGKITPGTKVDNTNNQYVILWIDKT